MALMTATKATGSVFSHGSKNNFLLMAQCDMSLMQALHHDAEGCITNQITTLAKCINGVPIRTGIDTASESHEISLLAEASLNRWHTIDNGH